MKQKSLPISTLEEAARVATQIALTAHAPLPQAMREQMVVGTLWDGDAAVFELYLPGDTPPAAVVLTETRVNLYDGRIESVKIHSERWNPAPLSEHLS